MADRRKYNNALQGLSRRALFGVCVTIQIQLNARNKNRAPQEVKRENACGGSPLELVTGLEPATEDCF